MRASTDTGHRPIIATATDAGAPPLVLSRSRLASHCNISTFPRSFYVLMICFLMPNICTAHTVSWRASAASGCTASPLLPGTHGERARTTLKPLTLQQGEIPLLSSTHGYSTPHFASTMPLRAAASRPLYESTPTRRTHTSTFRTTSGGAAALYSGASFLKKGEQTAGKDDLSSSLSLKQLKCVLVLGFIGSVSMAPRGRYGEILS